MTEAAAIVHDFGERETWNTFVAASPFGHFFQSWEWGDLQDGLGGRPHRIAAIADGRLVGCVQALVFDTGTRTFAYVPRGPVADPEDEPLVAGLVNAVVVTAGRAKANLVRLEPQWTFHPEYAARLERLGFGVAGQHIMPPRTLLVDLAPPLDAIWAGFRSNTRNRIRLAEKRGVRVGRSEDIATFARLVEETNARHGLRLGRPEQFFLASRFFGVSDSMRLFLARSEEADLAGIVVFVFGATATYLWGASSASEAARQMNPNQILHWTAMQWARSRGCTTYDMFGVPDFEADVLETEYSRRTDGWWNLYRFKRGFGGTVHRHLGTYDALLQQR